MTWLFVKMYPLGSTITPEPLARASSRGRRRKKRSENSSPKNSRNRSGVSSADGFLGTVLTFTTAGVTRSATIVNASSRAWSRARGSIAGCVRGSACADSAGTRSRRSTSRVFINHRDLRFYRAARGSASGEERQLEDAARARNDRRRRAPPEPPDPHDFPRRLDHWHPVALPAGHLGVDEEILQLPLGAAEGREA